MEWNASIVKRTIYRKKWDDYRICKGIIKYKFHNLTDKVSIFK